MKKFPMVFLKPMEFSVVCFVIVSATGLFQRHLLHIESIIPTILVSAGISVIYLLIGLKILFKDSEKKVIRSSVPKFLQKYIPKWIL